MSALRLKIPWLGLMGREGFEPVYPSLMRGPLIPNELPAQKRKSPAHSEAWCSDRLNAKMATYTKYNAHLFIEKQARYQLFLPLSSHYRDK